MSSTKRAHSETFGSESGNDETAHKKICFIDAKSVAEVTATDTEVDAASVTEVTATNTEVDTLILDCVARDLDSELSKPLVAATDEQVASLLPASPIVQVTELLNLETEGSSIVEPDVACEVLEKEDSSTLEHGNDGTMNVPAKDGEEEDESETTDPLDVHRKKQYRTLLKELKELLESRENLVFTSENLADCQQMIQVLAEKYKKKHEDIKIWTSRKHVKHPSKLEEFVERIGGSAEKKRKWMGTLEEREDVIPAMLMRAWDQISQCQIKDHRVGFLSGGSINKLNTFKERQLGLKLHADWRTREGTPFISFSSSLSEIGLTRVPHFDKRQAKKGILTNTKLTLINTRAITAAGKPILRMKDELIHYKVSTGEGDLTNNTHSWYEHEYIVPFCVDPEAIVATWSFPEVEKWIKDNNSDWDGWCRDVGVPAFQEHERVRLGGTPKDACKKGCDCCGH